MTDFRIHTATGLGAIVTLLLLASCGDQGSILAPTPTRLDGAPVARPEVTPGAEHAGGPALSLYSSSFRYNSPGGYTTAPESWVQLEVAAGEPVTVNWFGRFRAGAQLRFYRWTLDIADITDETPRIDEATDLAHWSQRSATTTSATVGPFGAGEQHFLYVEVADTYGYRSLATVRIQVVAALPEQARPR